MRRFGLRAALLATVVACIPACGGDDDGSGSSGGGAAQSSSSGSASLFTFFYILSLMFGGAGAYADKPAAESPDLELPQVSIGTVTGEGALSARIEGTAWDNDLVLEVGWFNEATGSVGRAEGTSAWSAAIPLAEGDNLISIGARDRADNRSLVSFVVSRSGSVVTQRD